MTQPERIEQLKDLHLDTDLMSDVVLCVPEGADWRGAAEWLGGILEMGPAPEAEEGGTWDLLRRTDTVMLGNAMNNPALMALYKGGYTLADEFYPGGDGFYLRTVHNPKGVGHNAVVIGAGTVKGAEAGLAQLEERLRETGGTLGYTNVARSGTHGALESKVTPDAFRDRMEEAYLGNALRGPIESGITMGLTHHLTGDPDCARMFREVLFYYESLVQDRHDGQWGFEHMLFIYAWTWRLFYVWDLIEESDAFSDEDRLRMTSLLWGLTNHVAGLPYFRGVEPGKEVAGSAILRWQPEIRQNHATFAALSMSFSAGYFGTYYGLDGFEEQLAVCKAVFDGQADCYKPNDDGGGGGYCWLVPNHLMDYDFRSGSDRFLRGGHLRELADYAVLITDNLGSLVGFGDVGSYGRRRTSSPGVAAVLSKAAWFYDEGGYLWALSWMGGQPTHGCYHKTVPERPPTWLTGVSVAPFNRPLYEWVERHGPGGANVPLDEAFDKLTLRSGFEEEDFYLLLDGTSTFAHGHDDGNSIERLTWKGRMWLAETDYIWRRPRHHCSVVSICDGESGDMPSLAGLKWAEALGSASVTRTTVSDYNGADWTRDLVWLDGRFLLVLDSVELLREADYDVRCLWRTLGETTLAGNDLSVSQEGVHFRILNADGSMKSMEIEPPRVAGQDPYASYDFADGPIQIFKERVELHANPGDRVLYANLMVAGTAEEVAAAGITRVAEGLFVVHDGDGDCVIGCSEQPTRIGEFTVTAGLFVMQGTRIALAGATQLGVGGSGFTADRPIHAHVDLSSGRTTVRTQADTEVSFHNVPGLRIDGVTRVPSSVVQMDAGEHQVRFEPQPPSSSGPPTPVPQEDPAQPARKPKKNRLSRSAGSGAFDVVWEVDVGGSVARVAGDGDLVAVGTSAGRVAMVDDAGDVVWRAETGGAVRALYAGKFGDGCLLVGGADCALTLFDEAGAVVWRRPFERSHGRDQIVNAVVVSDPMCDGVDRALVATDGWLVWALDEGGDEVWQRQIEHHAAGSLQVGDVDGDGRREILVGTEYYNSNLLEADGTIRWTIRGGPGFTALALLDLTGDGHLESVYGSMDGCVYAFDSRSGKLLWKRNLGDDVLHAHPVDLDGECCLLAGSQSGNVALLGQDGRRLWRADLGAPVTGLCVDPTQTSGPFLVGTEEGDLVVLDREGGVVATDRLPSPVSAMLMPGASGSLVVGRSDGVVALVRRR